MSKRSANVLDTLYANQGWARRYFQTKFSARTINGLARKGVAVLDCQNAPDGTTLYMVSQNGTQMCRTFLEILELAGTARSAT